MAYRKSTRIKNLHPPPRIEATNEEGFSETKTSKVVAAIYFRKGDQSYKERLSID